MQPTNTASSFQPPTFGAPGGSGVSSYASSSYASSAASPAPVIQLHRGLHLPTSTRPAAGAGSASAGPSKKRKLNAGGGGRSGLALPRSAYDSTVNNSRELDERDDVDDADLMAAPERQRRGGRDLDENYDEDEEGDGEVEGEVDGNVEAEGTGGGAPRTGQDGFQRERRGSDTEDGRMAITAGSAEDYGTRRGILGALKGKNAMVLTDVEAEKVKAKARAMKGDQMRVFSLSCRSNWLFEALRRNMECDHAMSPR